MATITGCAAQRSPNLEFTPTGELIVAGDQSQGLLDGELIGEHCTVNMKNGTVFKGIIFELTPMDLSIGRDKEDDSLEGAIANPIVVVLDKKEIAYLTLTREQPPGFSTSDMTVLLVVVPIALVFWFLSTYESPWG